jgi:hypothetical protein
VQRYCCCHLNQKYDLSILVSTGLRATLAFNPVHSLR